MSKETIIVPYLFDSSKITGERYLNTLSIYCLTRVCWMGRCRIFMHTGALAYYCDTMRDFLNQKFGNNWIERSGPVSCPARSTGLNPCDFYLWGHIMSLVYEVRIRDINHLKMRIKQAIGSMYPSKLNRVWENTKTRLDRVVAPNDRNVEHWMPSIKLTNYSHKIRKKHLVKVYLLSTYSNLLFMREFWHLVYLANISIFHLEILNGCSRLLDKLVKNKYLCRMENALSHFLNDFGRYSVKGVWKGFLLFLL